MEYDDEELIFQAIRWTPTIDGDLIKKQPLIAFRDGDFHPTAPVIVGTSTDETMGITFGTYSSIPHTFDAFKGYVRKLLGNETAEIILDHYGTPENISDIRGPPDHYSARITTEGRYCATE